MATAQIMRHIQDLRMEIELLQLGLQEVNDRLDSIPRLAELLARHEDDVRGQEAGEDLIR
jgi:hypothetical protein